MRRFEYLGEHNDINKAIDCMIEAVTLTPNGRLEKPGRLSSLGISYMHRFEHLGQLSDINRAIECQSEAVMLIADGHMEKPTLLNNLGSSYLQRFRRLGDLADIDKSIKCHSQAILLVPDGHENKATLLSDLGNSYQHRFRRLNEVVDIDKAIKFQIESVQLTPQVHSSMPVRLRNLGSSYASRFNRFGDIKDLERAIEHQSEAVVLTPDRHANMPTLLDDLGGSYMDRFKCLGELTDINNAIQYKNQAVILTSDSHVDKPGWLNNLGGAYIRRFQRQRELEDINKAIEYFNHAIKLIPNGHAFRPVVLNNLGESYLNRCVLQEERTDAEIASSFYQEAAQLEVTDPTAQLRAARGWASCSSALGISPQLAYQRAMELVPQLVWLGTTIDKRYETLTEVGNIAVEAAAWAFSSQSYELALEWLEEGRSIVWNQILQLRTPFDELSTASPTLAQRLMEVSRELEQAGSRPNSTSSPTNAMLDSSLEQQAERHHSLAAEWSQLLSQARELPGFHNFLRPRKTKELMGAAKNGPVVVVNVHSRRCDALILMPGNDGIDHIPLEDFTIEKATEARAHLLSFVEHRGLRSRGMVLKHPKSTSKPEQQFKAMLATLWSDVVKPVLDFLQGTGIRGPRGDEPRDVTWCTTGPLSFLPLHAAGRYDGVQPNTFDLVVSSYTPTLGALLASNPSVFNPDSGVLAVGQDYKNSPGSSLPNTIQELATIKEYTTSTRYMQLDGENATVDAVLNAMDEISWVHLACHASQHKEDPSQSAFQLYDGHLMLSMITTREFKNKGLAFLSACQTATGDEKLPDEAVHLAAGMLMAGYPSVIATMWGIGDKDAPKVAQHVYAELLKDGKLGSKRAAIALHRAVSSLREEVGQNAFERWVPFIHIGV